MNLTVERRRKRVTVPAVRKRARYGARTADAHVRCGDGRRGGGGHIGFGPRRPAVHTGRRRRVATICLPLSARNGPLRISLRLGTSSHAARVSARPVCGVCVGGVCMCVCRSVSSSAVCVVRVSSPVNRLRAPPSAAL